MALERVASSPVAVPGGSWFKKGSASLEVGLPGLAIHRGDGGSSDSGDDRGGPGQALARDGKLNPAEEQLAALQVVNDSAGYRDMLRLAKRWPQRTWAIEGAGGVGVQLAQRLVADGETVIDVPPKLSTRARIFDVGHGRKNDPAP